MCFAVVCLPPCADYVTHTHTPTKHGLRHFFVRAAQHDYSHTHTRISTPRMQPYTIFGGNAAMGMILLARDLHARATRFDPTCTRRSTGCALFFTLYISATRAAPVFVGLARLPHVSKLYSERCVSCITHLTVMCTDWRVSTTTGSISTLHTHLTGRFFYIFLPHPISKGRLSSITYVTHVQFGAVQSPHTCLSGRMPGAVPRASKGSS